MLLNYLPVLLMSGFAAFMAGMILYVSSILSPHHPYREKLTAWECGMEPVGDADTGHFRVHFFIIAILFILFDVETLFLLPWAVVIADKSISLLAYIEMFIFIGVLAVGLVYAWAKGALDWI
ncbi:MAG: NADH-quinone oxidoreductase subunit A [Deltaproteobacteria bacterium]|nr:NADH-quinone oxidoreductase subunit A [Deltaproteobacteria bacterium]